MSTLQSCPEIGVGYFQNLLQISRWHVHFIDSRTDEEMNKQTKTIIFILDSDVLSHPAYSLDLTVSDCLLVKWTQSYLADQRLADVEDEIEHEAMTMSPQNRQVCDRERFLKLPVNGKRLPVMMMNTSIIKFYSNYILSFQF